MTGRETASPLGLTPEASLSLARSPDEAPPRLRREEETESAGGSDFTSLRLPGRTASARLASITWGRELSTTGRIPGWSPLRVTRPIRSRSPVPIWRRAMSRDWSWSRRMTDRARLWAEKSRP